MARGRLILLAALFFAVVFSAGGWLLLRDRKLPRQLAVAGTPPSPGSPGPVLTGRVRPQRMVNVTAPVAGTVAARNEALEGTPDLINSDPYGEGWLVEIELAEGADVDALLDAAAYGTLSQ